MPSADPPQGATITYRRQYTRCGKAGCRLCAAGSPGHGPYWYAYWRQDGRLRSKYLGREAPPAATGEAIPSPPAAAAEPAGAPGRPALPALRARSLGGFQVWRGEVSLPAEGWGTRKEGALFKILLGAEGHRLHQERVAELLWPEAEPERAAASLRTATYLLRRALGSADYLRSEGALRILDPAPGGAPGIDWWDAAAFQRLAGAALAGADAGACRAALTLYTGDYLPGEPYAEWALDRREQLRGLRERLLLHLAALCERAGEPAEAERSLRLVLAGAPWQEEAATALLDLLAAQGRRVEALQLYGDLERALEAELGVAPGARARRLRALLEREMAAPVEPPRQELPGGILTFLLSDVEGSARLWERNPAAMRAAIARHDAISGEMLPRYRGRQIKERGEGDSIVAVFTSPTSALAAACALQQALLAEPWPAATPVRVRMGLHTGEAIQRGNDYHGTAIDRAGGIRSLAHGGQVLLSRAVTDLVRDTLPEGAGLRALGSHQLKGLERPEEVYQLLHPALPAAFPPLLSPQAPRNNLPAALSSLVGREREVAELRGLLRRTRLLTLTGEGGSGKTRLALAAAADLGGEYADGVWLTEMAALHEGGLVPQAVAGTLGLQEERGLPVAESLAEFLRERELLLLLDNCEHVLGACAALVTTLLGACPRLRVLATSREGLGVAGERRWRIPMLTVPAPSRLATLENLGRYEAVRLLLERGGAVRADFVLTAQNAWAVEQVCRRLDGLPLAIELAAARLEALSVEQLARRLDDRFRLLTSGSRAVAPHQRTLRATLDWSHDLLLQPEQILLRRLAVFAGGWTLEAAEAVCAGEGVAVGEVLDLLGGLAHKSLLRLEQIGDQPRYRQLETVRQYGQERLAACGEEAATRDRHLQYYLLLAVQAELELKGPAQVAWLDRLDLELDNVRAALAWSTADMRDATSGLQLAAALRWFWQVRGHAGEGRRWLEAALALGGTIPSAVRARALYALGGLAYSQGDGEGAEAHVAESLALFRELGDTQGIAEALLWCSQHAHDIGDDDHGVALAEESLLLLRGLGNKWGIAEALLYLGEEFYYRQSDYPRALACLEEALALCREVGDLHFIGNVLMALGLVAGERGEYARAESLLTEGLASMREVGCKMCTVICYTQLGDLACLQGADQEAAARYHHGLILCDDVDAGQRKLLVPWLQNGLGNVACLRGDYQRATNLLEESLAQIREHDSLYARALALTICGHAALSGGDAVRAASLYRESLALSRNEGYQLSIARNLEGLAAVAWHEAQPQRAAQLFTAAECLREAIGAPLSPAEQALHQQVVTAMRQPVHATDLAARADGRGLPPGQALSPQEAISLALQDGDSA